MIRHEGRTERNQRDFPNSVHTRRGPSLGLPFERRDNNHRRRKHAGDSGRDNHQEAEDRNQLLRDVGCGCGLARGDICDAPCCGIPIDG